MTPNMTPQTGITRLDQFLEEAYTTVYAGKSDWWTVEELTDLLGLLMAEGGWLPEVYCKPQPGASYSQYPLHVDPQGAFCVTAVAFAPSIVTPVHNHTVWGVIGVYRGEEWERRYNRCDKVAQLTETDCQKFTMGEVSGFVAAGHDIHSIQTSQGGSVSIHIYGADIVKIPRLNFDCESGKASVVYSSYTFLPQVSN